MKKSFFYLMMITALALTACASPTDVGTTQPLFSDQVATIVSATMQALPSKAPEPTAEPSCPSATEGTQLLRNEEMGYCLLYPNGHNRLDPNPTEVCLVPEGPTMGCHNANVFINVEDAARHTASQIADEMIADEEAAIPGIEIQRTNIMVSREEAVVLEGLSGVASSRNIMIVHDDRLYRLMFVPWDEAEENFAQLENLYNTVINSFQFLPAPPWVPSPTPIAQQLSVPSEILGTKFTAEESGVYEFKILSGSYSVCGSTAPYPACGKWATEILIYVNRGIAWTPQPNRWTLETDGINYFAPSDPDFIIGNPIYRDTAAEAEAGSIGSRITITLQKGDYVWLLPADGRDAFADNVGEMTLSISVTPLP